MNVHRFGSAGILPACLRDRRAEAISDKVRTIANFHLNMKTPVNLITGFLGVGKTTAMLNLLAQRPAGSRWAVLVNEFGQVGIDGATLTQEGVAVREVPGGCICCTAQLPLRVALTKLIREIRPERLLIEPTGLGHPAGVIDVLRGEGLASALELRNVICLIDPRQLGDAKYRELETYRDQIALADVLVANKCDLATAAQLSAFREFAAQCYPPKRFVAEVSQGQLETGWLDIESTLANNLHSAQAHDHHAFVSHGWVYPSEQVFDPLKLKALFKTWGADAQIVRAKGVFRIGRDWRLTNLSGGIVDIQSIAYRRDSRVDIIMRAQNEPNWDEIEAGVLAAKT